MITQNNKKYWILTVLAWLFCIGIPIIVILTYFPLWVERDSASTMSGISIVFLLIAIIPLVKYAKQVFTSVYSCLIIWAIFLGLFVLLENIISQMIIVCEVALGSNIVATILFASAKRFKPKEIIANG